MFKISIFPIKSNESLDLVLNIERIFQNFYDNNRVNNNDVQIKIYNRFVQEVTQLDFMDACLNDDIVIVDVTREGINNEVNNFDIINELPKSLEHVWIISRNYLPINLYGIDNGGYPSYKKGRMSNEEIEEWIKFKCAQLDFHFPRSENEKGSTGFHIASDKTKKKYYRTKNEQINIFISYRTKYENRSEDFLKKGYMFTVSELVKNLNKGVYHNGANKTAKYLDDGNLVYSSELNTKQRAWQLLAIIDREYISHCDEFWIYGSDDYLNSWWTLGELIIYSYLNYRNIDNRGKNTPRKIMFYNPLTNQVHEISPLKMDENIAERICRIISNCAPGVMGIDSVMIQRIMRDILYGDREKHDKAMCLYMEKQLTLILPAMLLSKGLDEKSIRSMLSDEDTIKYMTQLMEQVFEDAKGQISKGIIPEELKQISKQMLEVQSDMLGFDVRETVTEEEIITRGWSKEYLEDECFSEDFWETVMYNDTYTSKEESSSIDDINTLENQISKIDIKQILEHLSFKCPHHCAIGNISDLVNQKINKTPDGKRIRSKAPRYFFMPSRGGMIDMSPTHNNLYELPIFIAE